MADKVKIPGLGDVDKKKATYAGAAVAIGIAGVVYIRRRKTASGTGQNAPGGVSGTDSGIDPATGIPYADEGGTSGIDPSTGIPYSEESGNTGIYGSSNNLGNFDAAGYPLGSTADLAWQAAQEGDTTAITTNSQWITEAESGIIPGDVSTISAALSKVLGGVAVTSDQRDLFLEAVGALGNPPQGYPQPIKLTDTAGQPGSSYHTITVPRDETVEQLASASHWSPATIESVLSLNHFSLTTKLHKGQRIKRANG